MTETTKALLEKRIADCTAAELIEIVRFINVELATRKERLGRELAAINSAGIQVLRKRRSDAGRPRTATRLARVGALAHPQRLRLHTHGIEQPSAADIDELNALDDEALEAERRHEQAVEDYDNTHNLGADPR